MSEENKKDDSFVKRYDTVIAFVCLELIALTLFGIGGATGLSILQIVAVFVALMTYPFIRNNFDGDFKKEALITLIPLGILMALLAFGPFWSKAYYGGNWVSIILYGGLTLLGGLAFFIVGYGVCHIKTINPKFILLGLLSGLAVYVLLTGLYSLFRYGAFYAARYSGQVYYYEGVVFPIAQETKALIGFRFFEVALSYGKAASTILACAGAGLFAISPKKDKRGFFLVLGFALLGLLDLVLTPYKQGIIVAVAVYALGGLFFLLHYLSGKSEQKKATINKVMKIVFFVLIGLVALGVLMLALDAATGFVRNMGIPKVSAALASESGFFGNIRKAFESTLFGGKIGVSQGFSISSFLFGTMPTSLIRSDVFEFDILWQTGFLGFGALLFVVFHGIKKGKSFLSDGTLPYGYKLSIVALLLGFFLYFSFVNEEVPQIYSNVFMPFARNPLFFGALFILGMIHAHPKTEVAQ